MNIQQNVSLKDHSTMRLGGHARYHGEINSVSEINEYVTWAKTKNVPVIVIGIGSNIVWKDSSYNGLVLTNKIKGYQVNESSNDTAQFTFGAGENWDEMVNRTVDMGYAGLESLSLIPGTAGAAAVQNIGAYGSEIKDTFVSVRAYDIDKQDFVTLTRDQCGFGYRTSIFNSSAKGKYIIVSLTVKLTKSNPKPPFYSSLQNYFDEHNVKTFSPATVRNAVVVIRMSKLPDPAKVANNGSFFKNPIVDKELFNKLKVTNNNLPHWDLSNGRVKLSAAWLVESSGFKRGTKDPDTGMALWKDQALVLVNEHAKSTADLLKFKQKIIDAVESKFGIILEQEPELI